MALLASLAAVALDASTRKQPFNPEPVAELGRVIGQRIGVAPGGSGAPARMLDPETTNLLTEAVDRKGDLHTVESLTREGAAIVAALGAPLEEHDSATLLRLREFALRLSSAAQAWAADDPSFP
jgi:hypothetical protein